MFCRQLSVSILFLITLHIGEASSICPLPWNADPAAENGVNTTKKCPFGSRLPGDVTLPDNTTWVQWVCVVYGYLPFVVIGLAFVDTFLRAIVRKGLGTRETTFLLFVGFQVGLGELFFKKLAQEPRPEHSCNYTCGMPSSHSTLSVGFFLVMFLDASYRIMPSFPLDLPFAREYTKALNARNSYFGFSPRDLLIGPCRVGLNTVPMSAHHTLDTWSFIVFTCAWGGLLLPVPFTRVVLQDHTPKQVIIGSLIGIVEAVVFHLFVRQFVLKPLKNLLGKRIGGIFIHNHALPLYEVVGNSYCLLAEAELYDDEEIEEELTETAKVLQWYLNSLAPYVKTFAFDEDHPKLVHHRRVLKDLHKKIKEQIGDDVEDLVEPKKMNRVGA